MKWLIVSKMDMTFKDIEEKLVIIMDADELTEMITGLIIERAQLPNISKDEFEKILSLYRQKYGLLAGKGSFYDLKENVLDVEKVLDATQQELNEKFLDGPELAVDYVLSIFPKNIRALKLKQIINERRNR